MTVAPPPERVPVRALSGLLGTGPAVHTAMIEGTPLGAFALDIAGETMGATALDEIEVLVDGVAVPVEVLGSAVAVAGTEVTIRPRAGNSGLKSIGLVLAAVLAVAAIAASGGLLAPVATAFGFEGALLAGSTSANLLALGLSASAALLSRSLAAQPVAEAAKNRDRDIVQASASGNILSPGAALMRVIGTHKVYPQLGAMPLIDLDKRVEIVEAVYVLAGPHAMSDLRIDGTPIDQIAGLSYEIREGFRTDAPLSIVTRYSATQTPNIQLRGHVLKTDDKTKLDIVSTADDCLPQMTRLRTERDPDEIWLTCQWGEGLVDSDNISQIQAQPLRLRMRQEGSETWRNLPELHFYGREPRPLSKVIKLRWSTPPSAYPTPPTKEGCARAYWYVPVQTASPAGIGGWQAESVFAGGPGFTTTTRVALYTDGAHIYLPTSLFPRGKTWEIEVMPGLAYRSTFVGTDYKWNAGSTVYDLFGYIGSDGVPIDQENKSTKVTIQRLSTVVNRAPLAAGAPLAAIALRGRGINIGKLSCIAAGYVPDWDDALGEWSDVRTTSNPAAHFRDLFAGDLVTEDYRYGADEIDDTALLDWRDWCDTWKRQANLVVSGGSMAEVADTIAACGRAARTILEQLSVALDRDRSSESPLLTFSPRDARDFSIEKPFQALPDGFRCTFLDAANDYSRREIIVLRPGLTSWRTLEERAYTFTSRAQTRRAAEEDLAELEQRSLAYSFTASMVAMSLRRGTMVSVGNDAWDRTISYGLIRSRVQSGANLVSVTLDHTVVIPDGTGVDAVTNIDAAADIDAVGTACRMHITLRSGAVLSIDLAGHAAGATTVITLPVPLATVLVTGGERVIIGTTARDVRRLLVEDIGVNEDLSVTISARDEAPAIHALEAAGQRRWASGKLWASGKGWQIL